MTASEPSGMLLSDFLDEAAVRVTLAATDKRGALKELSELFAKRHGASGELILHAVTERERLLSTGIGYGVAIPHGRIADLPELAMVCGVSSSGIPFDAIDGEPVRLLFLIAGPESAAGRQVRLLSRIARLVRHEAFRSRLHAAKTAAEFCALLTEVET